MKFAKYLGFSFIFTCATVGFSVYRIFDGRNPIASLVQRARQTTQTAAADPIGAENPDVKSLLETYSKPGTILNALKLKREGKTVPAPVEKTEWDEKLAAVLDREKLSSADLVFSEVSPDGEVLLVDKKRMYYSDKWHPTIVKKAQRSIAFISKAGTLVVPDRQSDDEISFNQHNVTDWPLYQLGTQSLHD